MPRNCLIVVGTECLFRPSAILGRGANFIVIDDPIKPSDAFSAAARRRVNEGYDTTLYTRLNDKIRDAIVVVMQRLHEDDLVGHVLARNGWDVVSIPAIAIADQRYQLRDIEQPSRAPLLRPARRRGAASRP